MKNVYIVYFNDYGKVIVIADSYTECEHRFKQVYPIGEYTIKRIEIIENTTKEVIY